MNGFVAVVFEGSLSRLLAAEIARTCLFGLVYVILNGCGQHASVGEKLARSRCAACHAFPEPALLDKRTWEHGVLPQMAPRLGLSTGSLFGDASRNPNMTVLRNAVSPADWQKIVAYFVASAPDTLPAQRLSAPPQLDPPFFKTAPFNPAVGSSGIVTLLETDSATRRIFIGEAGTNMLRVFDWHRREVASTSLGSPPTAALSDGSRVLVLESGILAPNDEPRGTLAEYEITKNSLRRRQVLIDSLFRPVFVREYDFDKDGGADFLICEYGDQRGRLALYRNTGSRYERRVLSADPGCVRFELRDMNGDGNPDVVALFAQGDERIVLFENDGAGNFTRQKILARFPPVYGSMYFSMHDFNGDGSPDILYVNGDNFDYSRVLKPYHGIRILQNDGRNNFHEVYFFPLYGAARALAADFDGDGDLDILATSNFADKAHPERGIMFLRNAGRRPYEFQSFAFNVASKDQWNLMASADVNDDGAPDVIVGAMDLANIAQLQRTFSTSGVAAKNPILLFENAMRAK